MIGMVRGIPRQAVAGSLDMMNAALPQAFFHGGDRIIIKQGREETARLPDDGIDNGRQKRSVVSFVDSSSWVYIAVLILLVAFSGFFSATETAFTTINRIRLKTMAAAGSKRAALVLRMAEDYDRLLSTILIGNNIVNIASASIATVVFVRFLGDKGVTISTVVMTVVVLIFGEISPKSLAKQNAESFAMLAAPLLRVFLVVFKPLNWLFLQWKKLLNRVFRPRADTGMTGEELKVMVDEVQSGGSIDEHEGELIRSAIEFNDLDVEDILTPRVQVVAVEERDTLEEISDKFLQNGYSRMLVYRHTIDTLLGVIHEKDFYTLLHEGGMDLSAIIQEVPCVPTGMKISALLRQLQRDKAHLAAVVDEFGGTCGIVTMEDILEELVGEIWDEHDDVVEDIRPLPDGGFCVKGDVRLDDMLEFFHIDKEYDVVSVGGWAQQELGAVPQTGDRFEAEGLEVTITATEMRRVTEILVRPAADEPREERP